KRRFLLQDCGCIGEDLPLLKAQYCLAVCGFDDLLVRSKADISSTEAECPEAIDSVLHHAAHILNIGGSLLIVEPTRHLGDLILVLSKALLNPSSNSRLLRCDSLRLHGEKKDIVTFQFTRMSSKNYQPSHHYKALDDHLHRTSHK
ncbi:ankyrin repeat-containing protein, partial [Cystoisospora suis]